MGTYEKPTLAELVAATTEDVETSLRLLVPPNLTEDKATVVVVVVGANEKPPGLELSSLNAVVVTVEAGSEDVVVVPNGVVPDPKANEAVDAGLIADAADVEPEENLKPPNGVAVDVAVATDMEGDPFAATVVVVVVVALLALPNVFPAPNWNVGCDKVMEDDDDGVNLKPLPAVTLRPVPAVVVTVDVVVTAVETDDNDDNVCEVDGLPRLNVGELLVTAVGAETTDDVRVPNFTPPKDEAVDAVDEMTDAVAVVSIRPNLNVGAASDMKKYSN